MQTRAHLDLDLHISRSRYTDQDIYGSRYPDHDISWSGYAQIQDKLQGQVLPCISECCTSDTGLTDDSAKYKYLWTFSPVLQMLHFVMRNGIYLNHCTVSIDIPDKCCKVDECYTLGLTDARPTLRFDPRETRWRPPVLIWSNTVMLIRLIQWIISTSADQCLPVQR